MNKNEILYDLPIVDRVIAESTLYVRAISYTAGIVVVVIGWGWLTLQSAGTLRYNEGHTLGPGMQFIQPWLEYVSDKAQYSFWLDTLLKLCVPQSSQSDALNANLWRDVVALYSMWFAMVMAMMLPTAAPMMRTYADIAHVAKEQNKITVPLYILALGYFASWSLFCGLIAVCQFWLVKQGYLNKTFGASYTPLAGVLLIFAGFYQFSSLKDACLTKCGNPFHTLFARWKTSKRGVFRLGIEQGAYCIGCCWALMILLFVVGAMNLAWMAFLTIFSLAEKSFKTRIISNIMGITLIIWGATLIIATTL